MKSPYIITIAVSLLLLCAAPQGCRTAGHGDTAPRQENRKQVRMTGALATHGKHALSRAETVYGPISPVSGLPPRQLDVAIVTVNHTTADPANDPPGYGQWAGQTADITRGFFGSDVTGQILPGGGAPTNGLIEYTNESGDYIQRVFYPEAIDEYYFVKVIYPYEGLEFAQMPDGTGASVVFTGLTGQEDLLASNLGWGTQTQPVIETGFFIDNPDYEQPGDPEKISVLKFEHLFSQLRFWVVAENGNAVTQYGELTDIIVRFQPDVVVYRMIDGALMEAFEAEGVDYHTDFFYNTEVDADGEKSIVATGEKIAFTDGIDGVPLYDAGYNPSDNGGDPQGIYAGCLMVMPDYTYRIEAYTTSRKWIGADYEFAEGGVRKEIEPGKIYDVLIKFMESYELEVKVSPAAEYWMDSVFN